jgi:hypothetical protein
MRFFQIVFTVEIIDHPKGTGINKLSLTEQVEVPSGLTFEDTARLLKQFSELAKSLHK